MSLDEQYEQMREFARILSHFNDRLGASLADLQAQHSAVDPLWRDAMRRGYDVQWGPLQDHTRTYLREQGPTYEKFLEDKLRALEKYLYGYRS